jgi:hypothetical protein
MFIWKYIDLDPNDVDNLVKNYLEKLPLNKHFFQTLELGVIEFAGRPLFKTVLITAPPNSQGIIHKDHRPHDNNQLAINIPLINCGNSITEFWETADENKSVGYTSSGSPFVGYKRSMSKKISEFKLNRPVLFRTDIPHSVDNFSNNPRLAISLRFVKDPWDLV